MSFTHEDLIVITAGKRWNRFKDMSIFHPVRWMGESLISDYKEKMNTLRQVDDNLNMWTEGLENAIKDMEKAFKAKRFVDVYTIGHYINKNLENINQSLSEVKTLSEEALEQFSVEEPHLTEKDIARYYSDKGSAEDGLTSEAGIIDFYNRKKREWVAERLKTKQYNELIKKIELFFNSSKQIIEKIKNNLEIAGGYRRSGDIGKYLDQMSGKDGVAALQQQFIKLYSKTYYEALEPLFKKHNVQLEASKQEEYQPEISIPVTEGEAIQTEEKSSEEKPSEEKPSEPATESSKQEEIKEEIKVPEVPNLEIPSKAPSSVEMPSEGESIDLSLEAPTEPKLEIPSLPMETLPPVPPLEVPSPERKRRTKKVTSSHEEFLNQLKVVASYGDNKLTKKFILSYALDLNKSDDAYYKLIAIAEGLDE